MSESIEWKKKEFKNPVSFRQDDQSFIIRTVRNIKGAIMCECEMDDDKVMMVISKLPEPVQIQIQDRIKAA
jgi:hypothetical protein